LKKLTLLYNITPNKAKLIPITLVLVTGFLNINNDVPIIAIRFVLLAILYDKGDTSDIIVNATTLCIKFSIPSEDK
jgi:hypothetical protein